MNADAARPPRPLALLAVGALLGLVVSLPSFLMPAYRSFYQRRFPEVAASWTNDGSFTHMAVLGGAGEDQVGTAARVLSAARALVPGDPYLGTPPSPRLATFDTLGFAWLGLLQRLTGDLDATWVLGRVLSVAAFFAMLTLLLARLGAGRERAVFVAAVLTLFLDVTVAEFYFGGSLAGSLKSAARKSLWLIGGDSHPFSLSHFMRPALSYPAYLAAVLATLAAAGAARRGLALGAAAGLAGGALAYVHFDTWFLFCPALALFTALRWADERRPPWPLLAACAVAAAASLPFFLIHFTAAPEELEARPFLLDRSFHLPSLAYAAAAGLFWRRRRADPAWGFAAASQAAAFLLMNAGMLAPMGVQRHYVGYAANLTLMPGLAALALARLPGGERWLWAAGLAAALAVGRAVSYSAQLFPNYAIPKDYEAAFAWLKAAGCDGKVLGALDGEVLRLTPVHGRCLTLAGRANPFESDISNAENLRRVSFALDLFVPPAARAAAVERFSVPGGAGFREKQAWAGRYDRAEYHARPAESLFFWGLFPTEAASGLPGAGTSAADIGALIRGRLARKEGPYRVDFLWEGPLERGLRPKGADKPPAAGELVYENQTVRLFRALPRP